LPISVLANEMVEATFTFQEAASFLEGWFTILLTTTNFANFAHLFDHAVDL
jgi:hypothetical protein